MPLPRVNRQTITGQINPPLLLGVPGGLGILVALRFVIRWYTMEGRAANLLIHSSQPIAYGVRRLIGQDRGDK